ncbi:hypothetical protein R5R35_001097 [Gryllus longicercus]|uniref:Nucleoside diphosphate kinase n=2 Tax=Gryllus longicercus TaxID=2509291 RepID=A0AAN9VTQ0_9ORTH
MSFKRAMTKCFQLTLAIIKPHAVKMPSALHSIRRKIISNNFYVLNTKEVMLAKADAERFYGEHKQKFFYNRLVTLMSSGPLHVHILAKDNAIQSWRELMGPTKVYMAQFTQPATIRGEHGLSDTRNAVHGSDSETSAAREIDFFFPGFNVDGWRERVAKVVSNETIMFDEDRFVHRFPT